jgi:pimeloyl-ACP methyl ester carboxylesterase
MSALWNSTKDRIYSLSTRVQGSSRLARTEVEDWGHQLRKSGCRHLLLLVHGFSNSASEAKESYLLHFTALEEHFRRIRSAPDAIAFFHWPGDVGGYLRVPAYPFDVPQAKKSAELLAKYLENFPRAKDLGAMKISIVGHSLGCRLVLEMLAQNLSEGLAGNIDLVVLMAAAVPVSLVDAEAGELKVSVQAPRRIILKCYSHQDWVLWITFPLGQAFAYPWEKQFHREAVGLYGNPTTMGTPVQTRNGHSDYWGDQYIAHRFIAQIDRAFHTLPPPQTAANRALPAASRIRPRDIGSRE